MSTRLNPYLSFRDTAREAMEFYRTVFGGELTVSTFGEFGMDEDPDEKDKVMHSQLESPNGLVLMGADTPNSIEFTVGSSIAVSLSGEDEAELHGYWDKLVDGGDVQQPLEKAPWGDSFGMCVDRFGVNWMVNIAGTAAAEAESADD
jgi:PhnB protein